MQTSAAKQLSPSKTTWPSPQGMNALSSFHGLSSSTTERDEPESSEPSLDGASRRTLPAAGAVWQARCAVVGKNVG